MIIKKVVVGQLQENAYIVADETSKDAIVIDPGDEPERILDIVRIGRFRVQSIICTHGHFDHVGVVGEIKLATGAGLLMHGDELDTYGRAREHAAFWGFSLDDLPQPDGFLKEGDEIMVGKTRFRVIHAPGHSPGGICLYGAGVLFSGDTIFQGSIGRTDFPGGSIDMLKESFRRLIDLPGDTRILSGHGPETTIARERRENFFMLEL